MNRIRTSLLVVLLAFSGTVTAFAAKNSDDSNNVLRSIVETPFKVLGDATQSVFDLGKIVVTPTRTEESLASVLGAVTVMTHEELDAQGVDTVREALKRDYSIDVAQSGAFSGPSSFFLRGANAGHTQLMIDGVRVYDPISANGVFDSAFLTLDNIDQIEIVKGPQSSLYGSNAIGGVVNIINKRGEGTPKGSVFGEYGSFHTDKIGAEVAGQIDRLHFSMGGSTLSSDGISKSARLLGNPEKDGYENFSYGVRTDYDLSDDLSAAYIGRYVYADYDNDDYGGIGGDDINSRGWTRQLLSSVILRHRLNERFEQKVQLSLTGNHRRDFDDNDPKNGIDYTRDWFYGDTRQAEWQASTLLVDGWTLVGGVNHLREIGESYYYSDYGFGTSESVFPKRETTTNGYFIENQWQWGDRLNANASYRVEDHSTFSTHETYKVNGKYLANRYGTKLKAGYGTGFKAPTLYQLYVPASSDAFGTFGGGNTNLKPEESESYEIGVEQPFTENFDASLTYFETQFKGLIDAVFHPGPFGSGDVDQYANVGKAEAKGYETQIRYKPTDTLRLIANYTRLDTQNKDTHTDLLRRAENKANLSMEYDISKKCVLGANAQYVGPRLDSGNFILKRYMKVDLSVIYRVNENFEIYGNIDNLLDRKYEEIKGYGTPGFTARAGAKVKF